MYNLQGQAKPDIYSANHKLCSNFFYRFVTQENQYLLGNGAFFKDDAVKEKIGGAKFDTQLQRLGRNALVEGVSFGFFNFDHIEVFKLVEFVPLWDEEDGSLKAGIRFWQIDDTKPLRFTLYEVDGYTDFIRRKPKKENEKPLVEILHDKRPYKLKIERSIADGESIVDGENYSSFPIVPLWANSQHQPMIVGIRSQIDAYDLIKSDFAADFDNAQIYWVLENSGGMDDIDLAKFLQRMKLVHAANVDTDGGQNISAHTVEIPYQSRETYLSRIENDLYNDAMAVNTRAIAGGNITATAINASYEALNNKCDEYEYCILDFIDGILALVGEEDTPSFKRSKQVNENEQTTMVMSAASVLDKETIIRHLPFIQSDEVDEILKRLQVEEMSNSYFEGNENEGGEE